MKKTDIHVHAALRRIEFVGGNPENPRKNYIGDPKELQTVLEEFGVRSAILMSSGEEPYAGGHTLECYNQDCERIADESEGFFHWMCGVNPHSPQTVEQRLSVCKEHGAVGVGEVMINQWMDSRFMRELFRAAEKLGLPVLCHMSPEAGFSYGVADRPGLPLLEKTLQDFPNLIYIGHSQVFWLELSGDCPRAGNRERSGFGKGPVQPGGTVERLMEAYPNLYADLSGYSGSCAMMRDEAYGIQFLEKYRDRLFFGTDAHNRETVSPLAQHLESLVNRGVLRRETCERIFTGNAHRIFGVS